MTSSDILSTLASMSFLMDYHEKLGTIKNPLIVAEFTRLHAELLTILEKENEARTSADQHGRVDKDRAGVESSQPRSSESNGEYGGSGN